MGKNRVTKNQRMILSQLEYIKRLAISCENEDYPIIMLNHAYNNIVDVVKQKMIPDIAKRYIDDRGIQACISSLKKVISRINDLVIKHTPDLHLYRGVYLDLRNSNIFPDILKLIPNSAVETLAKLHSSRVLDTNNCNYTIIIGSSDEKNYGDTEFTDTTGNTQLYMYIKDIDQGFLKIPAIYRSYVEKNLIEEPRVETPENHDNHISSLQNKRNLLLATTNTSDSGKLLSTIKDICLDEAYTSIYITFYRLAADSVIIDDLLWGLARGLKVYAYFEIQASNEIYRNLEYAEKLEKAGAEVRLAWELHKGLSSDMKRNKVHIKALMAISQNNIITILGTGNWNEKTMSSYVDNYIMGRNATQYIQPLTFLFENMFRGSDGTLFSDPKILELTGINIGSHILWDPKAIKDRFTQEIITVFKKANLNPQEKYTIKIKVNHFTTSYFRYLLMNEIPHNVRIKMLVRSQILLDGTLIPANVTIRSKVGPWLEHDRLFIFDNRAYIGSVDFKDQCFKNRTEGLIYVDSKGLRNRLIEQFDESFETATFQYASEQTNDGKTKYRWIKRKPKKYK